MALLFYIITRFLSRKDSNQVAFSNDMQATMAVLQHHRWAVLVDHLGNEIYTRGGQYKREWIAHGVRHRRVLQTGIIQDRVQYPAFIDRAYHTLPFHHWQLRDVVLPHQKDHLGKSRLGRYRKQLVGLTLAIHN